MTSGRTRIGLLGRLELVCDGGRAGTVGGTKQRALLGALLLESPRALSTESLVEELWEDDPPPSASHTLETNVSRLRRVLAPIGVTIHRRGAGYVIDPGDAVIDAAVFGEAAARAREALAAGASDAGIEKARAALALWRGAVLEDVPLGQVGRAAAARLEEKRLGLLELVLDAELALGRHAETLPELQAAAGRDPFRERFVLQLMLALYRCGRQADALTVYERTRAALDEKLGLQPSPELQRFSARIVRHDPALNVSRPVSEPISASPTADTPSRRRRLPVALLAGMLGAAALAVGAGGGGAFPESPESVQKVALVLPRAPGDRSADLMRLLQQEAGFAATRAGLELEVETVVLDDAAPAESALRGFAERLRRGAFAAVVWVGDGEAAKALAPAVEAFEETTFVYVAGSLEELGLAGVPNASAVRFADEQSSHLMGMMAGLMAPIGAEPDARPDFVGIVAAPATRQVLRAVRGFRDGLRRALPGARLLVEHVPPGEDKRPCEMSANRQINAGADVVVSMAGSCGLGALAVAATRNVWAIGDDEANRIPTRRRERLLAYSYRDTEIALGDAIEGFALGTLLAGKTRVLGLDDDYSVGLWFNDATPAAVASAVVHRCSELRAESRGLPNRFA